MLGGRCCPIRSCRSGPTISYASYPPPPQPSHPDLAGRPWQLPDRPASPASAARVDRADIPKSPRRSQMVCDEVTTSPSCLPHSQSAIVAGAVGVRTDCPWGAGPPPSRIGRGPDCQVVGHDSCEVGECCRSDRASSYYPLVWCGGRGEAGCLAPLRCCQESM